MRTTAILCISFLIATAAPDRAGAQGGDARASFRFVDLSLRASLDSLMRWYPVSIVYLDADVEGVSVSGVCEACRLDDALNAVMRGTRLTWIIAGSQVIVRARPPERTAQVATVCGTVRDSLTGESIAGAIVLVVEGAAVEGSSRPRWCATNSYGFFSLPNVAAGEHTIEVRAVGYRGSRSPVVTSGSAVRLDILLNQNEIMLPEVTVEGRRAALASADGFSRGVFIRSAPSDKNQYFLDGARIYNPAHFGGVLTTFDDAALTDVEEMFGGMPPSYGGRIGGILDLSMREGTRERLSGSAGTGSLGSRLALEGPVDDATTFLVTGRRGYPDVAVPFLRSYGTPGRLGSTELIAKVSHRLSRSSRLFLSAYAGRDSYSNFVSGFGEQLSNNFSWGNSALDLRWIGIASPSTFLSASAVLTHYDFALGQVLTGDLGPAGGPPRSSDFAIEDVSIRADAEHYYDEDHTVRAGGELVHHRMNAAISAFASQTISYSQPGYSSWELSVYLQDQWELLPDLMVDIGARATEMTGGGGSFSGVDPRLSILVSADDRTRFTAALTSINEFLHPFRNSGVFQFYPAIFWYPSTNQIRPSTSMQASIGAERRLGQSDWFLSAESFYRIVNNLHEFGLDTARPTAPGLGDAILDGTGKTYCVGVSLRKRTGDLTGSIRYTYSWGNETFAELNSGQPFTPRFERRHEVQLDARYAPGYDWSFGVLCVLASDVSPSFAPRMLSTPAFGLGSRDEFTYDINGSRIPGFQRLELDAERKFMLGGTNCRIALRFMNGFGLLDPFAWTLQHSPDERLKWNADLNAVKLFPLFPTLGFSVQF